MSQLVDPHGGILKPLLLKGDGLNKAQKKAKTLKKISMSSKETSDAIMLAMGAFSPLEGFMKEADYKGVLEKMELVDGTLWPLPVTLAVNGDVATGIKDGEEVVLVDSESQIRMAIMKVEEKFTYDAKKEAENCFGTIEEAHPGVKKIYTQGNIYLGGKIQAISEGHYPEEYEEFASPEETRKIFTEKGWNTVAAFQTRNPMHCSHEYLVKIAMEVCDGVFVHPIVGKLKKGDIPAEIRMKCYYAVLDKYYPADRVVLKVYPMEMRYGGPKEAILHAIIRQNFGCSYLIIGRDHAGVGNYYGPFDAQNIFDSLKPGALEIKPLKLDWTFYCEKCGAMASFKTCPHPNEDHKMISGTKLREMLSKGEYPPDYITRAEVSDILIDYYKSIEDKK